MPKLLISYPDALYRLIRLAAGASGISMAAWLRRAAEHELREQANSQEKDGPPVRAALEMSHEA